MGRSANVSRSCNMDSGGCSSCRRRVKAMRLGFCSRAPGNTLVFTLQRATPGANVGSCATAVAAMPNTTHTMTPALRLIAALLLLAERSTVRALVHMKSGAGSANRMRARSECGGRGFGLDRLRQLAVFAPIVHSEGEYDSRQHAAKLVNEVLRPASVAGERGENILNIQVVAGVQNGAGPQASGLEPQPCRDETQGNDADREAGEAIPRGCTGVVVGEQENRVVPHRPHHAAKERGTGEAGGSP